MTLASASDIAFTMHNLQVTALIQDPQDPERLTPVATLLPTAEPSEGFSLGPLVPERGPIVFENTQVFPQLVDDLMRNPRGLVFKFSNYDLVDELGRNFAFTSQEINDRTAGLVIDYGGFDADGDGAGDLTESRRIATGVGRVIDTNGNGEIDDEDRRAVYDADGKQLGITLRDALARMGLTEYREDDDPTSSLTQNEIDDSYSVRTTATASTGSTGSGVRPWSREGQVLGDPDPDRHRPDGRPRRPDHERRRHLHARVPAGPRRGPAPGDPGEHERLLRHRGRHRR